MMPVQLPEIQTACKDVVSGSLRSMRVYSSVDRYTQAPVPKRRGWDTTRFGEASFTFEAGCEHCHRASYVTGDTYL